MADLITAFWWSYLLYSETILADEGPGPGSTKQDLVFTSLFAASGFVIGSVGSNFASEITFARLLWPERYYRTSPPWKLGLMGLTMSAAGPLQMASKHAIDGFLRNGLFKGAKEGDMLGTAFFEDTQTGYKTFVKREDQVECVDKEHARNNFWAAVIASMKSGNRTLSRQDEEGRQVMKGQYANRRASYLTLDYVSSPPIENSSTTKKIRLNIGLPSMLLGAVSSEIGAVLTGVAAAAAWHSPFALFWFLPLVLKLVAIRFRVRRTSLVAMEMPKKEEADSTLNEPCVFELDDHKHGYVLIQAPRALGLQFFRHLGHPQRNKLAGDRWNERISMALVGVVGAYFPITWMAFGFASNGIRLTWICYQLYLLATLLVLRYCSLERVGSLEEEVAETLQTEKTILLGDYKTGYIKAHFEQVQASSIAEASGLVEAKKREIFGLGKKDA